MRKLMFANDMKTEEKRTVQCMGKNVKVLSPSYTERQEFYKRNTKRMGELVKKKITDSGITIKDVSKVSGVSEKAIQSWCSGKTTPSIIMVTIVIQSVEYLRAIKNHKKHDKATLVNAVDKELDKQMFGESPDLYDYIEDGKI